MPIKPPHIGKMTKDQGDIEIGEKTFNDTEFSFFQSE
eukprot:CAMPEP_0185615864 /NCGR_PEP_ID=MMETSP0436-20130131/37489_1 /TAXON_ID=626734 ORGANISM="Favella taraikaensis, Strain Fe Narragansett Bay" /NCGR_SAMPLE_ID=MMETSP0436 /ASSEMBLY_ACC=CAM_ASM_000390 /LENGTH=36 /DNA_ID= /DNA_START= /DNA_END= /DNA_ORIENTATION=